MMIVNRYADPVLFDVLHTRLLINEASAIPANLHPEDRERAEDVIHINNWLKGVPADWLRFHLEYWADCDKATPTADAVDAWLKEAI